MIRVGILTVSTLGAAGKREDASGDAIAAWAGARGYQVAARDVVPDDTARIARRLALWCDGGAVDLVLTTGGTGLTPTDRTPEATRAVLEKEATGIAEYLRASSVASFPRAALARGTAGVRGATLVVNLPGSTRGVRDYLAAFETIVEHAVDLVHGKSGH